MDGLCLIFYSGIIIFNINLYWYKQEKILGIEPPYYIIKGFRVPMYKADAEIVKNKRGLKRTYIISILLTIVDIYIKYH